MRTAKTATPEQPAVLSEGDARKLVDKINSMIDDVIPLIKELHDRMGWRALGYSSWRACCKKELRLSVSWACRVMLAEKTKQKFQVANEAQARELRRVPEELRASVWKSAVKSAGSPGEVTARTIRWFADEVMDDEIESKLASDKDWSRLKESILCSCYAFTARHQQVSSHEIRRLLVSISKEFDE